MIRKARPRNWTRTTIGMFGVMLAIVGLLGMVGCGSHPVRAKEERRMTASFVAGESLRVTTGNGRVEIAVDPSRENVDIAADVTAAAATPAEAEARLEEIAVIADHQEDHVLHVYADFGSEGRRSNEGCAFQITLPAVAGVSVDTSNGAIFIRDTAGAADLRTSNGRIEMVNHDGPATVRTSNGRIRAEEITGQTRLRTSNGRITFVAASSMTEPFTIRTSNGSVRATLPASLGGRVRATTSNGSIDVAARAPVSGITGGRRDTTVILDASSESDHESTIDTSNGSIDIEIVEG